MILSMKKVGNEKEFNQETGILVSYKCDWCGLEWDKVSKKRSKVSDQVVCARCGNFIKTWD
jgi:DNA-directed RNA polymerase subunit RPC12/RpoP